MAAGGGRWGACSRAGGAKGLVNFLSATAFQERLLRLQWLVGSIVEPCVVATTVEALCGDARDATHVCAGGRPCFIPSRCRREQRARGVHCPARTARHQITA